LICAPVQAAPELAALLVALVGAAELELAAVEAGVDEDAVEADAEIEPSPLPDVDEVQPASSAQPVTATVTATRVSITR
jgi:hypothetical protein